jgi:hypothetical protein
MWVLRRRGGKRMRGMRKRWLREKTKRLAEGASEKMRNGRTKTRDMTRGGKQEEEEAEECAREG